MAITLPLGDVFGRLPARPAHAMDDDHRMGDITILIGQAHDGRPGALERLYERLHPDLRRIARRRLDEAQRGTPPDATAQVHDCYLRLVDAHRLRPADRPQFLSYAARALRALVVDAARARHAQRRNLHAVHVMLDAAPSGPFETQAREDEILAVDEALAGLAHAEPHLAEVATLRWFGGLDDPTIAEALGVPERNVRRDWETARALLAGSLRG